MNRVCRIDEIPDPGAREFALSEDEYAATGFLVREGESVYAYVNICPHAGRPLHWGPDRFLTRDGSQIMCAGHGALFEICSGLCVAGACVGSGLETLSVEIRDGVIYVGGRTAL